GKYLTVTKDDLIKQDTAHALLYKQPIKKDKKIVKHPVGTDVVAASAETQSNCSSEILSQFLSGAHLDGASPGLSTRDTVYWFNGALVILTIRLRDANALERGLQQVMQYRQQHQCSSFNAILMSIEHVVLVKVFPNGQIEHTDVMALFWVERYMSMEVHETPPRDPAEVMQQEVSNTPAEERIATNREVGEHNGQLAASVASHSKLPITATDPKRTFQSLITFFDAIALEHMHSVTNSQGRFPNEIYALIIQHVLDAPTHHACTKVSPTFRDLCLQNYMIGKNTLLLPSETCIPCIQANITPDWLLLRDINTRMEKRVALLSEDDCSGKHARRWFGEDLIRVLVGSEFNQRSLLPFKLKFRSLHEGEEEDERGDKRELTTRGGQLGWGLMSGRRRRSNTELLRKLSATVNGQAAAATFACGGSVDPATTSTGTPGVTIRWDASGCRDVHKTSFPGPGVDTLVQRCEAATFGLGNRDVLDEGYRKAGKLDNTAFSTDFHPHDYGIVDAVQQILMPPRGESEPRCVRAELYKLNWAAFYGDCEHEVLEVTSGHRVTLTYNLYYTTIGNRDEGTFAPSLSDPTKLPLYDTVAQMLREPNFMRKGEIFILFKDLLFDAEVLMHGIGGCIGFFCHHAYAHSTEVGRKQIPGAFKGVDLAVFSAFKRLGMQVGVHPILQADHGWYESEHQWGGLPAKRLWQKSDRKGKKRDVVDRWQDSVNGAYQAMGHDLFDEDTMYKYDRDWSMHEKREWIREQVTIVGSEMHGPMFDNWENVLGFSVSSTTLIAGTPLTDLSKGALPNWENNKIPSVIWMNEPQHQDFACAGIAYGNNAEVDYKFSAAAILVTIPDSSARGGMAARPSTAEQELGSESSRPAHEPMEASAASGPVDDSQLFPGMIDSSEESEVA
ncbi:MAG: hypothetical protein Q9192_003812, partial [Flavoplaca navasiana]